MSAEQAQAEMNLIGERLAQTHPETLTDYRIQVVPINQDYARHAVSSARPRTLLILLGVVVAVLLIACIHVANLLVARSVAREQEIALRAALGAGRLRIMRQLFTESVLLAAGGSVIGLLLAYAGLDMLAALRNRAIPWYLGAAGEGAIPWFIQVRIDSRVLLYVLGLFLITCVLSGTLPAIGATRVNVSRWLSASGARTAGGRFERLRAGLVVADIATAFVLLAGAGLLINSYVRVLNVDRRCNPRNVLTTSIGFDWRHAPEPAQRLGIFQGALRHVHDLPGVQAVSAASYSPITGSYSTPPFHIEGQSIAGEGTGIAQTDVFPGYFSLLEIPLLQGRDFTEHDTRTSVPVVILNEAAARHFWPGEPAVGRHLTSVPRGDSAAVSYEVVGVVGNVWHARYASEEPEIYVPYLQTDYSSEVCLMVRTPSNPEALIAAVRKELSMLAEGAVISRVEPMEESIAGLFSTERLNALLLGAFAAAALLLASIGIHGTVAYAVSWRTREIGIRMALGAQGVDILKTVLGQGLRLALAGVLIGLTGALALTRVIASLLYDVSPVDPATLACVAVLMVGVTLLASYLPARRAAKVDPMVALRYE